MKTVAELQAIRDNLKKNMQVRIVHKEGEDKKDNADGKVSSENATN